MALLIIRDLTHLAVWEDIPLTWFFIYLPAGGNLFVVCNSTCEIGIVASNGIKQVVVDVARTL